MTHELVQLRFDLGELKRKGKRGNRYGLLGENGFGSGEREENDGNLPSSTEDCRYGVVDTFFVETHVLEDG